MFDWYDFFKLLIGAIVAFYFKVKFESNNRKENDKNILLSNINFFKAIVKNDIFFFDKQLGNATVDNRKQLVFPLLPIEFDFSKCAEIFKINEPMGTLMLGYMNTRSLWLKIYSNKIMSTVDILHCKKMSSNVLNELEKQLQISQKLLDR